ncbi:MAG: FHA domain-containing protein [Acidimicrobiales bacterium]
MSEQLLDLLKLGLLALLYLFFLRVIWAVWTELRTPAVEPALASKGAAPARARPARAAKGQLAALRVVDPPEEAGTRYPLEPEMTIGRAPGCTVVVDDTFVSQLHARVFQNDGAWFVEDLGSTNGTFCNGAAVSAPERVRSGDRVQVGNWVLEVT